MEDYRRILLIKPSSLGDIVHTMPTCAAIRRAYPKARLTWLVKQQWAGLVERIDGVDRVWPVKSTLKGWLSQVSPLRAERFDLVVDLQGLFRSAAIGWLSGSPLLVGFANGREGSPWFYSRRVPVPQSEMHAVDRYLLVAKAVGAVESGAPEFRFRLWNRHALRIEPGTPLSPIGKPHKQGRPAERPDGGAPKKTLQVHDEIKALCT